MAACAAPSSSTGPSAAPGTGTPPPTSLATTTAAIPTSSGSAGGSLKLAFGATISLSSTESRTDWIDGGTYNFSEQMGGTFSLQQVHPVDEDTNTTSYALVGVLTDNVTGNSDFTSTLTNPAFGTANGTVKETLSSPTTLTLPVVQSDGTVDDSQAGLTVTHDPVTGANSWELGLNVTEKFTPQYDYEATGGWGYGSCAAESYNNADGIDHRINCSGTNNDSASDPTMIGIGLPALFQSVMFGTFDPSTGIDVSDPQSTSDCNTALTYSSAQVHFRGYPWDTVQSIQGATITCSGNATLQITAQLPPGSTSAP